MNLTKNSLEMIDFYKYLNCPACREVGLYCENHRKEVTEIIENQKL